MLGLGSWRQPPFLVQQIAGQLQQPRGLAGWQGSAAAVERWTQVERHRRSAGRVSSISC
jgi:hypothetical protein